MTITDAKYFREHSDVVQVAAYALHDVLHALKNDNCECLVSKEDGHLVVHYCKKRTESTNDKSSACTDGNLDTEPMIDMRDWNNVSYTKIPLNEEIFALLEDRMNPEKLRPAVIVAKMEPAKSISWTESKEGDVLCYDVPSGNFHSCNGADIKYWKHVNVPSEQEAETNPYQALKGRIRSMVAKYVSKYGRMSEAECASLNGMSCLQYDYGMK